MHPAVLTTPAALQVSLEQWRQASGTYDPGKLNQLVDIITKHQLHGRYVQELLYDVLSVCTGLPHGRLSAELPLPSYSTQHRALHTAAVGRKQQVQGIVEQQQLVGLECDEGTFQRLKHFVVLAVLPYHQRQLLGVPTITDTAAQVWLCRELCMAHPLLCLMVHAHAAVSYGIRMQSNVCALLWIWMGPAGLGYVECSPAAKFSC